jgi:hypothetical protein
LRIFRIHTDIDAGHLKEMRELIAQAREMLQRHPPPDTFAGRKTQEPFPLSDADERAEQRAAWEELEAPEK